MGYPEMDGLLGNIPIRDDLGVALFMEASI